MKIIKSGTRGKSLNEVTFTCSHCGCIYSADSNEYRHDAKAQAYYANCPYCHYMNVFADTTIRINADPDIVRLNIPT